MRGNHYRLLVETPEDNWVTGMEWPPGTLEGRRKLAVATKR